MKMVTKPSMVTKTHVISYEDGHQTVDGDQNT
jgi:hypothetical protein